jgi:hypothetical protein
LIPRIKLANKLRDYYLKIEVEEPDENLAEFEEDQVESHCCSGESEVDDCQQCQNTWTTHNLC